MPLDDLSFIIENDINPIIIFNKKGNMLFLNKSAELLCSMHISQELYSLSLSYAPKNFGSKMSYIDLYYGGESFYGIMVAYQNENNICLVLYKKNIQHTINDDNIRSNINSLLESSIEYFKIKNKSKISLLTDSDIPLINTNQNKFLILMRKTLDSHNEANHININLNIKLGAMIKINDKKHHIIQLQIKSNKRNTANDEEIKKIAKDNNILMFFNEAMNVLEIIA